MVVDLSGEDKYHSQDSYLAAAILGMAIIIDLKGDDQYFSERSGLAFSLYGFSLLYDASGDDKYRCSTDYSQASSVVGSALLVDLNGNDHYWCRSRSQAFGSTLGSGIFLEYRGDDKYNLDSDTSSSRSSASHFIQGAAQGRWAKASDGQSLAGGLGIFIDQSGDDHHNAGSFSQGASYFFGLGLCVDGSGDDYHNALSHSQGYAAHHTLAGFFERSGDDTYNETVDKSQLTQIIGSGRDLSVGLFVEERGHDIYHFGNRSMGIGDMNGTGLASDCQGNDRYFWYKNSKNPGSSSMGAEFCLGEGQAIGSRIFSPLNASSLGIHVDNQGNNIQKIIEE
jgi:hypothetical protein